VSLERVFDPVNQMEDPAGWNGKVKFSNLSVFDKAEFKRNFLHN
jgi:hypothetical protein